MGAGAVKLSADPHEQISPYHICSSPGQDAARDTGLTPEAQLHAQGARRGARCLICYLLKMLEHR